MTPYISALLVLMSILLYVIADLGITFPMQLELVTTIACCTLLPLLLNRTGASVTPARLFAISIAVFLLARPLLYLALSLPMVQAGQKPQAISLIATIAVVSSFSSTAALGFSLPFPAFASALSRDHLRIRTPEIFGLLLFATGIVLCVLFLTSSVSAFSVLRSYSSYFDALDDPQLHSHVWLFFQGKMMLILGQALLPKRNLFLKISVILFVAATGFLLIGLRGYFIIYLALAVFFAAERYKINVLSVVILGTVVLFGAGLFLQYRIGTQLFAGPLDVLITTLHTQGATFEVAYGAVAYSAQLSQCINPIEYLGGAKSVGVCIDTVRDIGFASGGFGTSIVAELYFLSLPILLAVAFVVGLAVRVLQDLSIYRLQRQNFVAGLILIMTIPNLFYIGRSDATDFASNFAVICAFALLFYLHDRPRTSPTLGQASAL